MSYKVFREAIAGLALVLFSFNASATYSLLQQWRCEQDNAPRLDGPDNKIIAGRLAWGIKCYPDLMEIYGWKADPKLNTYQFPQGLDVIYHVFGIVNADGSPSVMKAPTDVNADCNVLQVQAPKQRILIVGFCGKGCLTPDQVVAFGDGEFEIGSAAAAKQSHVITLSEGSNLGLLKYQATPLRQIVSDLDPIKQAILRIATAQGHTIEVTVNHPLIDGQGVLRRADQYQVGDSLARADGSAEEIASVEKTEIFGKVYNVRVDSPVIEENIYVSQGFLSGSVTIQNEKVEYLNRKLLRKGDLFRLD